MIKSSAHTRRSPLLIAWLSVIVISASLAARGEDILKQKGNWNYTMEAWVFEQPPEKRIGQGRWDAETGGWFFNFGPTGIRVAFDVNAPRVARVMYVYPDSPAHKKIVKGDQIIGVNGKIFSTNEPFPPSRGGARNFALAGPRLEVAKAIEESEGDPKRKGILSFIVRREGKNVPVALKLRQLGYFSDTFPYNCKKSRLLAEEAGDWLIEHRRQGKYLKWGPPRMGEWIDAPAHLALLSFGDRYKKLLQPSGKAYDSDWVPMWSWISGIACITYAETQQACNDRKFLPRLGRMAVGCAKKGGPSGQYSHKTYYDAAAFRLAFAAGLNGLGMALAQKCGAEIDEDAYLRTRYLLTCKTGTRGELGYGAANKTPLGAVDAHAAVGKINPAATVWDPNHKYSGGGRLMGGSATITLIHFVDPRDRFSEAFVKRGVRYAMCSRWASQHAHGSGSLTFIYSTIAASIAPLVGEQKMYREYMDDMKWWLNITRCHDGGWYFEPKIDSQANKYERLHTTTAAILMLNAPLRQLYVNGKGHKGDADSQRRKPLAMKTKKTPVAKKTSRPPQRSAEIDTLRESYTASLRKALIDAVKQGRKPTYYSSRYRMKMAIKSVAAGGELHIVGLRSPVSFKIALSKLDRAERASLALGLVKRGVTEDHARAAFFLFDDGKRVNDAKLELNRAKEAGAKVREAFGQ
jgi:hypothetical protein